MTLYVLSGDDFFLRLRTYLLYNVTFEHRSNIPPWLQLDLYETLVWLFLNSSFMFTTLLHSTVKCILGFTTEILLPSCALWSVRISSISSSDKWTDCYWGWEHIFLFILFINSAHVIKHILSLLVYIFHSSYRIDIFYSLQKNSAHC